MPKTYTSQLLHQITYFRYHVTAVIDGDIIYLIQVRGVEICIAYITVLCGSPSRWLGLISALPGFSTVSIPIENIKVKMILLS